MALTRRARLLVVGLFAVAAMGMVLIGNEPQTQYSVDELMQSPADFAGEEVHIRGSVLNGSLDTGEHTFSMGGGTYNLTIDFAGTAVPPGFEEGRVVAIKGLFSNQAELIREGLREVLIKYKEDLTEEKIEKRKQKK